MARPQLAATFFTSVNSSSELHTQVWEDNDSEYESHGRLKVPTKGHCGECFSQERRIPIGSDYPYDIASVTVPEAKASLELGTGRWTRQTEGTLGRHGPNPRKLTSLQENTYQACQVTPGTDWNCPAVSQGNQFPSKALVAGRGKIKPDLFCVLRGSRPRPQTVRSKFLFF